MKDECKNCKYSRNMLCMLLYMAILNGGIIANCKLLDTSKHQPITAPPKLPASYGEDNSVKNCSICPDT